MEVVGVFLGVISLNSVFGYEFNLHIGVGKLSVLRYVLTYSPNVNLFVG